MSYLSHPKGPHQIAVLNSQLTQHHSEIFLEHNLLVNPNGHILPVCSVGCLRPVSPWVEKLPPDRHLTRTQLDEFRPVATSGCAPRLLLLLPAPFWRRRLPILLLLLLLVRGATSQGCQCPMPIVAPLPLLQAACATLTATPRTNPSHLGLVDLGENWVDTRLPPIMQQRWPQHPGQNLLCSIQSTSCCNPFFWRWD